MLVLENIGMLEHLAQLNIVAGASLHVGDHVFTNNTDGNIVVAGGADMFQNLLMSNLDHHEMEVMGAVDGAAGDMDVDMG